MDVDVVGGILSGKLLLWTHWMDFPMQFWIALLCFGVAGGGSFGANGLGFPNEIAAWTKMRKYVKENVQYPKREAGTRRVPVGWLWVITGHGLFSSPDMHACMFTIYTVTHCLCIPSILNCSPNLMWCNIITGNNLQQFNLISVWFGMWLCSTPCGCLLTFASQRG